MENYNDNLQRICTLTLRASNGTLNDDDIAKMTKFNGINLLDGTGSSNGDGTFTTQSSSNKGNTLSFSIADTRVASLVGTIDVMAVGGTSAALNSIDSAVNSVNTIRAELGAAQNQHVANISSISLTQINTAASESQMRDVDFALESMNFSRKSIMSQAGSFAQVQANSVAGNVLNLLR